MSKEAAYELSRQHNRYHKGNQDPTCPFCDFEREMDVASLRSLLGRIHGCAYSEIECTGCAIIMKIFADHEPDRGAS